MNLPPASSGQTGSTPNSGMLRIAISVAIVVLVALAWFVATASPYKAKSAFGHNMGWLGAGMMCFMLAYSLRKRFRFFGRLGQLRYWFQMHMAFGILGPLLALFHSTFKIGSMNSRVALYSMLLVAGSGIIGRFVYRHIHHGLYGRKATLAEFEEQMQESAESLHTAPGITPRVAEMLADLQTIPKRDGLLGQVWHLLALRMAGRDIARAARRAAYETIDRKARDESWSRGDLLFYRQHASMQIDDYVEATYSAATFATWERLFALWHVLHVPFIYLFFISVVVHVITFYMY